MNDLLAFFASIAGAINPGVAFLILYCGLAGVLFFCSNWACYRIEKPAKPVPNKATQAQKDMVDLHLK